MSISKSLLLSFLSITALNAQTAVYPGAVATDGQLMVAVNNYTSTLSASLTSNATSVTVASVTGLTFPSLISFSDSKEIAAVCNISGNSLIFGVIGSCPSATGRGFDGTLATAHTSGAQIGAFVDAWHHNALKEEVKAIEGALGANLSNVSSLIPNPLPVNKGGTGVQTATGILQGNGTSALSAVPAGTARQMLRVKPNQVTTGYEFTDPQAVLSTDYNWPAQTPGGSLTGGGGSQSITLTPCPYGIAFGSTLGTPIYISGGTGTAESLRPTGGTCTGGAASGTVIVAPANNHSGAWTVSPSTAGISEAIAANPFRKVYMPTGTYTMRDCIALDPTKSLILYGDTYDPNSVSGTQLNFTSVTSGCHAINVINGGPSSLASITLKDFAIGGTSSTTGGSGIYLSSVVHVAVEGVQITGFAQNGIETSGSFEVRIEHCLIYNNGQYGIKIHNTGNLVAIRDNFINFNSRSNNYGNIYVVSDTFAVNQNQVVIITGNDIEAAGQNPFTAVATAYGMLVVNTTSIEVGNNYFEDNTSQPIFYSGTNFSIFEHGNFFGQIASLPSNVVYSSGVQGLHSYLNTFNGANAYRTFQGTDLSSFSVGPDYCESTSTECTTNTHRLGSVSAISLTGAFTAAVAANYIATESGANNAIAGALLDQSGGAVTLAAGLQVKVKLAHTLQVGANTFTLNGTAKNIKSHLNAANNIGVAYAATGLVTLMYDGTQWLDMAQ